MGLWKRLFGTKSLEGIVEPTHVEIDGRIASPDDVTSPVSPIVRGAAVKLTFAVHHTVVEWKERPIEGGIGRDERELYEHLATFVLGEPFVVACEGGEILVPTTNLEIRFAGDQPGPALSQPLPPELAPVLQLPLATKGVVHLSELALRKGDKVRVHATIAPAPSRVESDGYRGGESVRSFEVRPDLGRFFVEDHSLDPD